MFLRHISHVCLTLLLVLVLAACNATPAPTPVPQAVAPSPLPTSLAATPTAAGPEWTILVFMDADNDLETETLEDINEMEQVGSSDHVSLVVQLDRGTNPEADDTSNGDWTSARRFLIQKDDNQTEITSPVLDDLGEVNMGDPQTLVDFVAWGVKTYPAQHYALIFADHGSAWEGILGDESHEGDTLQMSELADGLKRSLEVAGIERFDAVGFDACLMASIDVLKVVAPYASTFIGSAELEPGTGWPWNLLLTRLATRARIAPRDLATAVVEAYEEFYVNDDDQTTTLSAFDLTRYDELRSDFEELIAVLRLTIDTDGFVAIAQARAYVELYDKSGDPDELSMIDIGHFAQLLTETSPPEEVAVAAFKLGQTIERTRIAIWRGADAENSTGLSAYFPQNPDADRPEYREESPLPNELGWGELFDEFYEGGENLAPIALTDIEVLANEGGVSQEYPATAQGNIEGPIAYAYYAVYTADADSNAELVDYDFIYPQNNAPRAEFPRWEPGPNALRVSWNATRWALSNGSQTTAALFDPVEYGGDLYSVEGTFIDGQSGESFPAGMLFANRGSHMSFISLIGYSGDEEEGTLEPAEIEPLAGDQFTPLLVSYDENGNEIVHDGEPLNFGDQPLSALRLPVADGDYELGFEIEDLAGEITADSDSITVAGNSAVAIEPAVEQASSDTLQRYSDSGWGFGLEFPRDWEFYDSNDSSVIFYNPDDSSSAWLEVQIYELDDTPDQAAEDLLIQYLDEQQEQEAFESNEPAEIAIAGRNGFEADYRYTDEDGNAIRGRAITLGAEESQSIFLLVAESYSEDFDADLETYETVAGSFEVR